MLQDLSFNVKTNICEWDIQVSALAFSSKGFHLATGDFNDEIPVQSYNVGYMFE